MPLPSHSTKPKWDWDLAFALFAGGLDYYQILARPEFRGLGINTLRSKATAGEWTHRRNKLARLEQASAVDNAAKALQDRLIEEGQKHQSFVLNELERERVIFQRQPRTLKDQMERLTILGKLDDIARKTSKLDEVKPANPVAQNFAFLIHLQDNTHLEGREAYTGILSSKNAIVEAEEDAEIAEKNHMEPVEVPIVKYGEVLKAMPPSLFDNSGQLTPEAVEVIEEEISSD